MRDVRRLRVALLATLLLAAGCSVDDPAPTPGGGPATEVNDEVLVVPEARVTPAESAAAATRVHAHSDSVRRAAHVSAGVPADDPPPPPASLPPTPEEEYAGCMAQAHAAEGHARAVIERVCESRRRNAVPVAP